MQLWFLANSFLWTSLFHLWCILTAFVSTDGTAHNLNEYMDMSSLDVIKSIGPETVDTVLTQKLGVLASENQLVDLFAQLQWCLLSCNPFYNFYTEVDNIQARALFKIIIVVIYIFWSWSFRYSISSTCSVSYSFHGHLSDWVIMPRQNTCYNAQDSDTEDWHFFWFIGLVHFPMYVIFPELLRVQIAVWILFELIAFLLYLYTF